ncbi:MAG: hypothetical protein IKH61_00670 [Bacteroidales bacterium]|nr:hypothetical protein [Bacteroidales bacterium]
MNKVAKTLSFLLLLICIGCEQKPPYRIPHYYENEEEMEFGEEYSLNTEYESWEEGEDWEDKEWSNHTAVEDYVPERLFVPAGVSFEQALYQSQPQLYKNSDIEGLGGAKLIAEMSSDAAGIPYSRDNGQDRIIKIQPMHILKIHIDTIPPCIFSRIMKKEVIMRSCVINSTPSIFDEHFDVNIVLTNNTGILLDVTIRQGTMIESETENVQNIVVTKHYNVSLPPLQTSSISVLAYCAAHHRSSPSGRRGRITPYVLNAPSSVYNTQQAVWDYIEAPARNKMTFYAWGRGMETGNGHVSPTGHAFVYVPRSGYWGFGSGDGNWIDGQGSLFDHSRQRQYATDSCSVYITDQQLNDVFAKLRLLRDNTPRYHMGIYDCTSFTMDIADAAGVYYGSRWLIQTPIGFMEQLKKYNR